MYDSPTPRQTTTTGYGTCDLCSRRVLWCITAKHRKRIAVDPEPDPAGNQAVSIRDTTHWARQLSGDRPHAEEREVLRRPHIATCPVARAARARATAAARRRTTGRSAFGVRPVRWQR